MSEDYNLKATIKTNKGDINLNLYAEETPLTVSNFINLSLRGFYKNLVFHRVINNFMIQGGCPLGNGTGGPGYKFEDEFNKKLKHEGPGILSMANSGPETNGSQFFITHLDEPHLDMKHTVYGKVVGDEDQDVVNSIAQGDQIQNIEIDGDYKSLFEKTKDRIKDWDYVLDRNFPDLEKVEL